MTKPASELIALADAIRAWQQNPATTYTPTNILRDHGDTIAELARLATTPAQPAPNPFSVSELWDMKTHGKPDGAVREQHDKLHLFLSILDKAGGETSGNDDKWNWINYFCDDAAPLDTFNQASKRGLTRVTHDVDNDNSVVYLTDAGRAFIAALSPKIAAVETSPGDAYREVIDEALIVRHLGVAKGNAKAELNQILDWDVAAALDPAVSGRKA